MEIDRKTIINGVTLSLFVLIVIIAGTVILSKTSQIDQLSRQNENLNITIETRDSLVNEMTNTFDEIEQNLTFIRNKQKQLVVAPQEGVKGEREILVSDIRLMNEMLEQSSSKIDELEKKLKSSGIEIKSFKSKIARLNKTITEQNEIIQNLKAEIDQRDFKINGLDAQLTKLQKDISVKDDSIVSKSKIIADKSQAIVEKENEINKAYFASGSHKELIRNGILSKEGGFLGIGKNASIKDDLNEDYFTQLDIRKANQFPLNAKKARLISKHPYNSYRLIEENDKIAYLEIENPQEFWKLTKYAIVETKN